MDLVVVKKGVEKERKIMSNRVNYGAYANYRSRNVVEAAHCKNLTEVNTLLETLKLNIKKEGFATTADYYELTGGVVVEGDNKFGWTDLLNVHIHSTRYGYEVCMPMVTCLKRDSVREAYELLREADEENAYDIAVEATQCLSEAL